MKITDATVHQITRNQAIARHKRIIEAIERVHAAPSPFFPPPPKEQ